MASVTDICNRALQKLGASRIQSLTDQSVNARACSQCYEILRDALLRAHPWNFAIQRFSLAASATAQPFGPKNSFPLPAGALRLLPPDAAQNFASRDWTVEAGAVISDMTAPLQVRCVMRVTDTTLFDPLFVEALSSKMASEMCEQITQSNTKKSDCDGKFKNDINEAKKANAIEKIPQESPSGSWISARDGGFTSGAPGSWNFT